MSGFADMSVEQVRQWGDDAYAELCRQELARLTVDELTAALGCTPEQVAPYRETIRPVDILAD